ncbi:Sulfite reduction-associated complex DsrMKJOP multiheme protein DsrJ (=HmeF) [Olavius algarvensis associated proteobacterium Delta 3]|nr:Sulfite reduction-associated complex DsrMKJOP multiheme protein DsrJ (=HmeF) [Olavius algarvensis associated proteobacterium Delta 3]
MTNNNKSMYNSRWVIALIIVFLVVVSFPFWYNLGKASPAPTLENQGLKLTPRAVAAKECVRDTTYMRAEHMQLLDIWRDTVVRDGKRLYVTPHGKSYNMSLSNTCLDCHANKEEFCDKCHTYASVDPYCWDCHIDNPKEKE